MTYIGLARALLAVLATLVLFVAVPLQSGSAAPDGIVLAPHRAIYELTLATTRGGSGVSSVLGRMAYDLTDRRRRYRRTALCAPMTIRRQPVFTDS